MMGSNNNPVAAEYLRGELESYGYETTVHELSMNGNLVRVVEGLFPGRVEQNRYTVLGAHYDHVPATESGAYDNATGVATVALACRELALSEPRRSVACLFFDAEENGLYGSRAWVREFADPGTDEFRVVHMFGYDMAGIAWPGKDSWPLYGTVGLPNSLDHVLEPHAELMEAALLDCVPDKIGLEPEGLEILRVYDRNSDEKSFMNAGIPIVRFYGGRNANDYPYYHRAGDTIEGVYQVVGGRLAFEMGLELTIEASYYSMLAFDLFDPASVPSLN
ncbi:MAG: M20/M25/M40 family metallo-hydrolase [Myxococcales bacterium FL481]|nr:MAG: M20/M25/M40 family metallo-hydrolase [Myxococcales bacterium FL481]